MSDYFDAYNVNRNFNLPNLSLRINELPVNLLDFALISCMRHRVYGAKIFGSTTCEEACCLNDCARGQIWRLLFGVQQHVMAKRRITASPAYITEDVSIDDRAMSFMTKLGWIESVDVTESFQFLETAFISPFIINEVDVIQNPSTSVYEAYLDRTIALNPLATMLHSVADLYDGVSYELFPWNSDQVRPSEDGFYWVMECPDTVGALVADPDRSAALQDYELMYTEIDEPSSGEIEDVVALHPRSNQILPFAKEPERVLSQGTWRWRFWFYSWTMAKPEFNNEILDLTTSEFYKLYHDIELYLRVETTTPATVYIDPDLYEVPTTGLEPMTDSTELALCRIKNAEHGLIQFREVELEEDGTYKYICSAAAGWRYKVGVNYKINPEAGMFNISTEEMRRAIVAKAAAGITLESCFCDCHSNDYISEMQTSFTDEKINPFTGSVAVNTKYGHRLGDLMFAEMLNELKLKQKGVYI